MGQALGCLVLSVKLCGEVYKALNTPVEEDLAADDTEGQVFALICALDYKQTSNPLSCSIDGRNVERLLASCGVPSENIVSMYDEQCTKENVLAQLESIGQNVGDGDYFVFYYSGHGTNLQDQSGDEADGQDEAFCFVTPDGQINYDSCMSDDTFAAAMTSSFGEGVKILILTDCCHSGTIADFKTGSWGGRKAISITGCLDGQTSGDIGRGGIFTHSMLLAIGELQREGEEVYSVGKLYNKTLKKDNEVFNSEQSICLQCSPGFMPNQMAWPLVPKEPYTSPMGLRSLG